MRVGLGYKNRKPRVRIVFM